MVVQIVGVEHLVVLHVHAVGHIPQQQNFSGDFWDCRKIDRSFWRIEVSHTQQSRHCVAHVAGCVDGSNCHHARRNVCYVDAHHSVFRSDVFIAEQAPRLEAVALVVVHGHITHEIVLHGVLAEIDVCPHLGRRVLSVRSLNYYLGDSRWQGRLQVAESDGVRSRHCGEVAKGIVCLHGVLVGAEFRHRV